MLRSHQEVLDFWFPPEEAPTFETAKKNWFSKNAGFDGRIVETFSSTYDAAAAGDLDAWKETAEGTLALILTLDQFPRNMFRGSAKAFATDPQARETARHALARGYDKLSSWTADHRVFFYLPFEHSENLEDQTLCLKLIEDIPGVMEEQGLHYWAMAHYKIIERFGRFPHRNKTLGRDSSVEETAFLLQPNSGF